MQLRKRREKPFTSIRQKIFMAMFLMTLAVMSAIVVVMVSFYVRDVEKKVVNYSQDLIEERADKMNHSIDGMEEELLYKSETARLFSSDAQTPYEKLSRAREFGALLENHYFKVDLVYVLFADGTDAYYSRKGITQEEFTGMKGFRAIDSIDSESPENRGTIRWRRYPDTPDKVWIYKTMLNTSQIQRVGRIVLCVDEAYFSQFETGASDMPICIYDEQGGLLYGKNNPADFRQVSTKLSGRNWTLVGLIDEDTIWDGLKQPLRFLTIILLGFIAVCYFVSRRVTDTISSNLLALTDGLKQMKPGEEFQQIEVSSKGRPDESAYLIQTFNKMAGRLSSYADELAEEKTGREKAEYNSLIAQMNPHFLYNTLGSISALAKLHGDEAIVEATDRFSRLLRVSLSDKNNVIPLEKELENADNYLFLRKMTGGSTLDWDIISDGVDEKIPVPKLILQPLLENSIVHGYDEAKGSLYIGLIARIEEDSLILEVSDDGKGMSGDVIDELFTAEEVRFSSEDRNHIGVRSIQSRLKYLYGDQGKLDISSTPGQGTVVTLTVPILKD